MDRWWHTGGYMMEREGDQCRIWLSNFREEENAIVPYDPSMPDWLFDQSLNFFGDGVCFKVEIPWCYASVTPETINGIVWRNWERQPYDDKTPEELFDMLTEEFYPNSEA